MTKIQNSKLDRQYNKTQKPKIFLDVRILASGIVLDI